MGRCPTGPGSDLLFHIRSRLIRISVLKIKISIKTALQLAEKCSRRCEAAFWKSGRFPNPPRMSRSGRTQRDRLKGRRSVRSSVEHEFLAYGSRWDPQNKPFGALSKSGQSLCRGTFCAADCGRRSRSFPNVPTGNFSRAAAYCHERCQKGKHKLARH